MSRTKVGVTTAEGYMVNEEDFDFDENGDSLHDNLSVSGIKVSEVKALPCPFCGLQPDTESEDFIHQATRSGDVWSINCSEIWGGCSASILGNSPEDVLRKWNRRNDLTPEHKIS